VEAKQKKTKEEPFLSVCLVGNLPSSEVNFFLTADMAGEELSHRPTVITLQHTWEGEKGKKEKKTMQHRSEQKDALLATVLSACFARCEVLTELISA
jgi:hypothetical protein